MTDAPKETQLGLGPAHGSFQQVTSNPTPEELERAAAAQIGGADNPPLPVGMPMRVDAKGLTPMEKENLLQIGWKPGDPIPDNLAEQVAALQIQAKREATDISTMPPPAAPDLPPLKMPKEIDIAQLPDQERAKLQAALKEVGDTATAMEEARKNAPPPTVSPGVRNAAMGIVDREVKIEDDLKETREERINETKSDTAIPESGTTTQDQAKLCPHCSYDLSRPDDTEVTEPDKQTFLQATLGNVPWVKAFSLLNDQLHVTIRQLRPVEVDACYMQGHHEADTGKHKTAADFWEQVNRYRMVLQLTDLRSAQNITSFPNSLEDWGGKPEDPNPTTLPEILSQVYEKAIMTESVNRILFGTIQRFNRLVAKLEANVENSDFWKATDSQT